ncbi:MAG: zinc ribbon domain-containing protein [Gemmatimonadaceae bacterium]|nr:zinc ribbon domain-containing protein [Gemmatimonadaceae bacterium]
MTSPAPCPTCGAAATGRFCSSCGTALAGASCASCAAPLTPGARFCHRCGTPSDTASPTRAPGLGNAMPWAVAAIALVALIALVVGQRFGSRPSGTTDVLDGANAQGPTAIAAPDAATGAVPAGGMPRAPDISQLTPAERAERLYDRIMREAEAGKADEVHAFLPMAVAAYEMIAPLTLDQRYDLGRIGEVGGDTTLARAQADTILRQRPTHLLGLILGAKAARMVGNEPHARQFDVRLLSVAPKERAAALPEYLLHRNDIDQALAAATARK